MSWWGSRQPHTRDATGYFSDPPVGRQSCVQSALSECSSASVAIIADLWDQLEAQDYEFHKRDQSIKRMQWAM